MTKITLNSPRYRVVLGDAADETTWTALEVQAITKDLQQAEGLFMRHKWGKPSDQPLKMTITAAFYALLRVGLIEGTWEEFEASYLEVGEAGSQDLDPTPEEPAPA